VVSVVTTFVRTDSQWCSQALKSGWAQGVCGTEVLQRGPGAEPWWVSGGIGRSPQKPDVYREFAVWNALIRKFVAESVLHLPPTPSPPKKLFGSARIPWPNTAGAGWARAHAGWARAHPWVRYCRQPVVFLELQLDLARLHTLVGLMGRTHFPCLFSSSVSRSSAPRLQRILTSILAIHPWARFSKKS